MTDDEPAETTAPETTRPTPSELAPNAARIDWEAFYRNFRKPGYVPGFEITSKLGGGMFGLVFKARKQSIGRTYAIKFLKVDDQEVQRAVLGELESVRFFAQVDHPNLVSIEDRGEVDGIPYIVMAYAGNETLRDRLAAPDADTREILGLFLQACRGVHALHERSLVHFDLKPANIFIAGNVARVGDYGLSKLVAHSRNSLSMGRGTPYYMAPEMLQRKGDGRSDIYALGVILYECLTGEVPFKGDSEWEVLRKHESEAPSYPDTMAPEHRAIVARCLAKDPEQRFATAEELIDALQSGAMPIEEPQPRAVSPQGRSPQDWSTEGGDTAPGGIGGGGAAGAAGPRGATEEQDDPYAELRSAAKQAGQSARQIARDALGQVRYATQRSLGTAREAVREHRRRKKEKAWPRWGEHRPRRRRGPARFGVLLLLVVVPFVTMCSLILSPSRSSRRGPSHSTVRYIPPRPAPPVLAIHRTGKRRVAFPATWVNTIQKDPAAGADTVRNALQRWQSSLPQTPDEMLSYALPLQAPRPADNTPPSQRNRVGSMVRTLAKRSHYDQASARKLQKEGYAALIQGIEFLEKQNYGSKSDLARAARINRFLREFTKVDAIRIEARSGWVGKFRELNEATPAQWRWFVHEFLQNSPENFALYLKSRM